MNQIKSIKLAYIQANWHADIVKQSYAGFVSGLEGKIPESNIDVFDVPGSLEIPLQAQLIAKTGKYILIVAAGFIVDGGIYQHEFVAQAVLDGMIKVQLENELPILSVVLSPHNFQNSEEHLDFFRQHFRVKGKDAAYACLHVLNSHGQLTDAA